MNTVYLSIGSNLGNRLKFIQTAVSKLAHSQDIVLQEGSSLYETAPQNFIHQPAFFNIVLKIATSLPPLSLLQHCQAIEQEIGRVFLFRFGPRYIDIDMLSYNERVLQTERLQLPHPSLFERTFGLLPLAEILNQPTFYQKNIAQYIAQNQGQSVVKINNKHVYLDKKM